MQLLLKCLFFLLLLSFPCWAKPKLSYEEIERFQVDGSEAVKFSLKVEGVPEKKPIELYFKKLDGSMTMHPGECNVKDNHLYIGNEELIFCLALVAKGEPIVYMLKTRDNSFCTSIKIIPFPIIASDDKGHSLSIEMTSPDAKAFLVYLKGYQPLEKVKVCSQSRDEIIERSEQIHEDGNFNIYCMPAVKGYQEGDASYTVESSDGSILKIDYVWGSAAFYRPKPSMKKTADATQAQKKLKSEKR